MADGPDMAAARESARRLRALLERIFGDGSVEDTFVRGLMLQSPRQRAAEIEKMHRVLPTRWPYIARPLAAAYLRSGQPPPPVLAMAAAEMLESYERRPKDRTGTRPGRDLMIAWAVQSLAKTYGLRPTRNASSPAHSACDAAAEAWGIGYKVAEKAWTKHRLNMDDADWLSEFSGIEL